MRVTKSKKDSSANDKLDQLIAWHEERYSKWHNYREHGGSDPTWPDGSNMNLLRTNYHTIGLISHTGKVMLKLLQARLQQYVNCEMSAIVW